MIFSTVLIVRASGLSNQLHKEQTQNSDTVSELQNLKDENQQLNSKLSDLTSALSEAQSKSSSAESETQKLKEENQALQSKYDEMQKKISQSVTGQSYKTTTGSSKVAYLTFDDGPSQYTAELLNTLKANGIHATFFVVGTNVVSYRDVVKRAYNEGNVIGIHCYNHSYSSVYASRSAFFNDFNRIKNLLTDILGKSPCVCRFPGGTGNTVSDRYEAHFMKNILPQVISMGITPFDWNVEAGDAEAVPASAQDVVNNVIKGAKQYSHPVILCHDIKKNTVDAMPSVISQLKLSGYSFGILSANSPPCRQNPV